MIASISRSILYLFGWSVDKTSIQFANHIIIGAPHTSNWDFPLGVLCLLSLNVRFKWVAKDSLFKGPLQYLFRPLSGIPINRGFCASFLKEISQTLKNDNHLNIAIMPEGTRSRKSHWKIGFYYLALKGNMPIALGYIDYKNKRIGIGEILHPTGDITQDIKTIQVFYTDKTAKNPDNVSIIAIKKSDTLKMNALSRKN